MSNDKAREGAYREALNIALDTINANAVELANRGFYAWAAANYDIARRIRGMATAAAQ